MSTASLSTHDFTADGVRLTYHRAGRGPVCVAHPGGPGLDWSYLRSAELEQHYTVIYPEPVGTGRSGRPDDPAGYRLETYVRFLAALVEHLGEPKVFLLGHSYGGFVVQTYALARPERVAGLILYSTSPYAGPEFWQAAAAGVGAYPQRHPGIAEAEAAPAAFRRAQAADDDESISREFAAASPIYFADFWSRQAEFEPFRAGIRMYREPAVAPDPGVFDVRSRLGEIHAPTVVIVGAQDFIAGPAWGAPLGAGIPGAQTVTLEQAGHFAHVEQPADFARAVALIR
ncbi:alpha/beta fold hydrolase [Kineosporia succinea]|uniref:Proline iminopeptidase n=1 Tax=Kineosporia succinea TaxID=84632 RepID=A0ABT9PAT8_9ACTN|nr:alpha/beta hydrolase [Kineosporia succinea]MDP9829529.1 proline iminopeptidase [Kineosporia succinea]